MNTVKCPVCRKPYHYKKCLANHMTKYETEGYKVYPNGVFRQKTLGEFA